jgi:methylated-DNA-[protein]-cysteine S-methyltransferase
MIIVAFPFINVVQTPLGKLVIKATQTHIHQVYFDDDYTIPTNTSPLTQLCSQQVTEYFAGTRQAFDLPMSLDGTVFQLQVWKELLQITYGTCISYTALAQKFNDENLVRAVANANAKNKLAIIIPCHRVIATDGKLTGYAWGLKRKRWLIDFEAKQAGTKLSLF